jgi:tetratricopeptide (TPR) repeat protein
VAQEDFAASLRSLDEALQADPLSVELWERRARARLLADSGLEGAEEDASRALELLPSHAPARLTRARIRRARAAHADREDREPAAFLQEALEDLSEVLKHDPRSTEAWAESGRLELDWARLVGKAGDAGTARAHHARAVRAFEEALRLNDSLSGALRDSLREARRGLLGGPP